MKTRLYFTVLICLCIGTNTFSQNDSVNSVSGNQMAHYECSEGLVIDFAQRSLLPDSVYFRFEHETFPKNLDSLNFRWDEYTPDKYLIAYLINTSDTVFIARRQDGSLMMIQEALNEKGEWEPIEYWVYSGCGNSYFDPLKLAPNTYSIVPIKRYSGDFQTKIRLKWKNRGEIIYSESFDASIDPAQFSRQNEKVHGVLYGGAAAYFEDGELRY